MSTLLSALAATLPRRSTYAVRLARSPQDVRACQALRFEVFNVELDEGLAEAWDTGLDADRHDAACDHLMVEDGDGMLVGTYRLQSGRRAAEACGYYSAREFDFAPFEPMRDRILELGRACVHRDHRNFAALDRLWDGIAAYAAQHGLRYLLGCSSLTGVDESAGAGAHALLRAAQAPAPWQTRPHAGFACALGAPPAAPPKLPRLLSMYLALGARVCGPPAVDREFRTIDFLTWFDLGDSGAPIDRRRALTAGRRR